MGLNPPCLGSSLNGEMSLETDGQGIVLEGDSRGRRATSVSLGTSQIASKSRPGGLEQIPFHRTSERANPADTLILNF